MSLATFVLTVVAVVVAEVVIAVVKWVYDKGTK